MEAGKGAHTPFQDKGDKGKCGGRGKGKSRGKGKGNQKGDGAVRAAIDGETIRASAVMNPRRFPKDAIGLDS